MQMNTPPTSQSYILSETEVVCFSILFCWTELLVVVTVIRLGVLITCANVVGHSIVLLNKYAVHGTSKTMSEWCEWSMILKSICLCWDKYFLPKKLREHIKERKSLWDSCELLQCIPIKLIWKLYLLCKQLLFLLSCEKQALSVLCAELHFGSAQDPSSLMWSLTLHCLLEEILQSLPILCLPMEKMMEKQKRSGPRVCYEIFNRRGYITC